MKRSLLIALAAALVVLVAVLASGVGSSGLDDPASDDPAARAPAEERPSADLERPAGADLEEDRPSSDERTEVAVEPRPVAESQASEEQAQPWFPPGDEALELFVRYADGRPAQEIKLTLLPVGQELHMIGAPGVPLTSEDGRYRVEGVAAGRYHFFVHDLPEGTQRAEEYWADHPVPTPVPIEVVLHEPASVEGVVLDGEGELSQAMVEVHGGQVTFLMGRASTRGDGTFTLGGLAPGRVALRAMTELAGSEPYEVDLLPGQVLKGVELRLPAGGYVEVHVLDESGGLSGDHEVILLAEERIVSGEESSSEAPVVFGPLPPGTWSVVAVDESSGMQSLLSGSAEVVAGETTVLTLAPSTEGITVSGTMTRRGQPEGGEKLYFFREGMPLVEGVSMCESDAEGRFELLLPEAGAYQIMEEVRGPPSFVERVVIPEGETFHHDVRLPGGAVSGRVIAGDAPGGRFRMILEREDRHLDRILPNNLGSRGTDEKGFFHFESLRPGSYRLRLEGNGASYAAPLGGILVGADEHVEGIELHLRPGAGLEVIVRKPDGGAVSNAFVQVRTASGVPLLIEPRPQRATISFDSLPAEPLLVSAQLDDLAGVVTARPELDRRTEVTVTLQPAGHVLARAESGGEACPASFRIFTQAGDEVTDLVPRREGQSGFRDEITSSKKRFGPLPPGRYEVTAATQDGRIQRRTVRVVAGEERELVLEL